MKHPITLLGVLFFSLFSHQAVAQKADDIIGIWMPSEGTSNIQVYKSKENAKYYGRIVWLKAFKRLLAN